MAIDPFTGEFTSIFATSGVDAASLPRLNSLPMRNPPGTALGRAFGRGIDALQQNIGSVVEGVGRSAGIEGLQAYGADVAARNAAERARSAQMEPGGLLGYVAGTVGENAPQMGLSVALPTLGAAFGGPIGAGLGVGASALLNYALLAGENRERQKEVAAAAGLPADVNEAAAFGTAVPQAALETAAGLVGGKIALGFMKGGTATKLLSATTAANAAKAAGRGIAAEVPTEIGQQALTRAQAGQELTGEEAGKEYLQAGLGAAVLGGLLGGGGSVIGDYGSVRAKKAEAARNDELARAVDEKLRGETLGATPPLASKMTPPAPEPEQFLAPQPQMERPLQRATDAQLLADLTATERRLATPGEATQDDARNLRLLRGELSLRDAAAQQPGSPLAQQDTKSLTQALEALQTRAAEGTITPEDRAVQRVLQTELAQRQPDPKATEAEARRQGYLFEEMSPEAQEAEAAQVQARETVRATARKLGLSKNAKFYEQLQATSEEELVDAVLDGVARAQRGEVRKEDGNLDKALSKIAYEVGVGRDFDADIQAATAKRDAIADKGLTSEKQAKSFMEAQREVARLQKAKTLYADAVERQRVREQRRSVAESDVPQLGLTGGRMSPQAEPVRRGEPIVAQDIRATAPQQEGQLDLFTPAEAPPRGRTPEQLTLPGTRNLPVQQAPERGEPIVAEDVRTAPPQIAGQGELRLMPPETLVQAAQQPAAGPLGEQLQARLVAAERDRAFEAALSQRLEQQAPAAEVRADEIAAEPVRVTKSAQSGNQVTLTLSRGAPAVLERKADGAWYEGDRFLGRTFASARKVLLDQRDAASGVERPRLRAPTVRPGAFGSMQGADRVVAVRDAINRVTRGWPNRDSVAIVDRFDTLPQDVQDQFTDRNNAALIGGFVLPDGRVFMIAENLFDGADAVATFYHELLGHYGLQAAFGKERVALLNKLYETNARARQLVADWRAAMDPETYDTYYSGLATAEQLEEALAQMSEAGPLRTTWLDRMKALVLKFARQIGLRSSISDAEFRAIVARAHRDAIRLGGAPLPGTATKPAATRGEIATPAEIQQAANTYADPVRSEPMLRAAAAATKGVPPTPEGDQTVVSRLVQVAKSGEKILGGMTATEVRENSRTGALYVQSLGHIAEQYGRLVPMTLRDGRKTNALKELQRGNDLSTSVRQISARMANGVVEGFDQLSPQEQQDTQTLMEATFLQLDPMKRLEDHKHLTPTQQTARRKDYEDMQAARNRLARAGQLHVYERMRALNDADYFQQMVMDLYDLIRANEDIRRNIPSAKKNPTLVFAEKYETQGDLKAVRAFWEKTLNDMVAETEAFTRSQGSRVVSAQEAARINSLNSALTSQLKAIADERAGMQRYPYFHLGRFGDYFATFRVRTVRSPDGKMVADPRAVEVVAEELHKLGLDNVVLKEAGDVATVFIRTEHQATADAIQAMAKRLIATGEVDGRSTPRSGVAAPLDELPASARKTLNALIAEFEAANQPTSGDDAEMIKRRQEYVDRVKADLTAAFLARLPEASEAKVMARRNFRGGFDRNMLRSFAHRRQIAANAAATRVAMEIKGDAISAMRDAMLAAQEGGSEKWAVRSVLQEVLQRERDHVDGTASSFVDTMRAINHNYFLALNPGYWLTQVVQLQTNLWPELVKGGVSYKRGFEAMVKSFPTAFKLVQAAIRAAAAQGLAKYGADATITLDVLNQITLSKNPAEDARLKDFVLRMFLRGSIDIGSASRELGRIAEDRVDTLGDKTMRWASAGSYYLEMMTRLTAALAARDIALEKGKNLDDTVEYAADVVQQSMFNYTEANRGRAFSRQGVAGKFTPLATAFLTFQFQMLEKYSREIGTAFINSAATPAEKQAARRWLGSHLVAMTTLAGSLGLPFVTVVARVVESIAELLDEGEEPFNVKAAWRNLLTDTFGTDVGEVLARGLPRAIGFDISGRVGAADILPFSKLIADRREWKEALEDFALRSAGAPFTMVNNVLSGGNKILDGQFYDGMKEMVPVAIKSPMEAVKIGTKGLTDANGNLLPIEPSTMDIIWQSLGLTPAARAEYSEANFAQSVRRAVTTREAAEIRKRIISAVQGGDKEALREALLQARDFDQASPAFAILPNIGQAVRRAQQRMTLASQIGAPMGVKPADIEGIALTRFANY